MDITRHKIGLQQVPVPALVLYYSRNDPGSLRKRVMPARGLEDLGANNCATDLVEAHKEYLDGRYVDFKQVVGLCEKLASVLQKPDSKCASVQRAGKSAPTKQQTPKALDRGLLREMELDFNSSGSDASPPAGPGASSFGGPAGVPPPSTVPSASSRRETTARGSDGAVAATGLMDPRTVTKVDDAMAMSKAKPSAAKGSAKESKGAKESKKSGKKSKKAKKGGAAAEESGWSGPSLNSLLGMSDEDEAHAAPPSKRGSMSSLAGMPSLF